MVELKSKFTFFRSNNFVYLDNAATTQVPDKVIQIVRSSLENRGNPHRGAHTLATKNEEKIELARNNIARFINCSANELVFTNNTTDSINLAVDSIIDNIKKGDELIIPVGEHHSNLLPFDKLIKRGAILHAIPLIDGIIDIKALENKLSSKTKIVALQHCSNVLGSIQPVEKIGRIIKKYNSNILYFVDGAQAVAHIPVDIKKIKCDFYSFSGHKMYAPSGIGALFVSKKIWPQLTMVRQGGGTISDASIVTSKAKSTLVYDKLPSLIGLEGGTPNVEGIIGLSEACSFIRSIGFEEIVRHEQELLQITTEKLEKIPEITILGPKKINQKIGVISFSVADQSISEIGDYLNKRKIAIRHGSHCAFPLINELGSETLRISLGCYNDIEDIERVVQELQFYLDKKKGLIKNKNLEILRDKIYYKNIIPVNSKSQIISKILTGIRDKENTEVVIMAGHFLAIPDFEENTFHPSIKGMLPEKLHKYLDELGMTNFPVYSWQMGCEIVKILKQNKVKAKLITIANDTTGINELRLSEYNKSKKTAEDYRNDLLNKYSTPKIPDYYNKILQRFNLSTKDILTVSSNKYVRETILRARFKNFIEKNKKYFDGVINYTINKGAWDLSIKVLDNQEIKTCRFDTFNSKTGGKFCIVEVCQFISELFGKADDVKFDYISENILNPKIKAKHKMLVMLTPAMCDDAVTRGAELYSKLMLQEKNQGSFKFFNIPLGPDSARYLATGTEIIYISDKDLLQEIDVNKEPEFPELWKLCEYNLLYNVDNYTSEIEDLFKELNITKKSKILDTSVGPGFFTKEMILKGYSIQTADKSKRMIKSFADELQQLGIKHETTISTWLDLPKHYKKESFNFLFNRGNTIMYANGGWNEEKPVNKKESLTALRKTLQVYYHLLKKGGYLYVDKYKDEEIPAKKTVATLKIKKTKEKKDIVFYVERRPKNDVRYAQMLLRDSSGKEEGIPNMAYDLTEDEMETMLKEVGFKIKRLNLKSEKHFVVWLAQK